MNATDTFAATIARIINGRSWEFNETTFAQVADEIINAAHPDAVTAMVDGIVDENIDAAVAAVAR